MSLASLAMLFAAGRNLRMTPHEYAAHLADWTFLNGCFPRKIKVSDIDGFVEMSRHFLFFEWGWPSKSRSKGQQWALERLAQQPRTTVLFIVGKMDTIVEWHAIGDREGLGMNQESLQEFVTEWADATLPYPSR